MTSESAEIIGILEANNITKTALARQMGLDPGTVCGRLSEGYKNKWKVDTYHRYINAAKQIAGDYDVIVDLTAEEVRAPKKKKTVANKTGRRSRPRKVPVEIVVSNQPVEITEIVTKEPDSIYAIVKRTNATLGRILKLLGIED